MFNRGGENMERSQVCFVFLLALAHQGLCLIAVTEPERDVIVAGSEGDGGIVFNCSIYNDLTLETRRITVWSLTEDPNAMPLVAVPISPSFPNFDTTFNITGDPTNFPPAPSFNNVLTILNFTADLDGQTLICGTGGATGESFIAGFPLRLYLPPNPPELVTVIEDISTATSLFVYWQGSPPTGFTPVSQYEVIITADDDNTVITERTTSNQTSLLVDDLLPGTAYSIQVVAIATVGDVEGRSIFSNTHQTSTSTTVPAPVCVSVDSDRGNITVTWAFTHTGGLDLTSLAVNYTFMEGEVINTEPVTVSLEQTSATVGGLEVARRYTFSIIGSNELGPGQVVCTEFLHSIGIPQAPKTPLISQSGARDVRLNLTTVAAGVGPSPHSFRFNVRVTNINNVQMDNFETFRVDDYASGEYRDFLITDLTVGQAYTFSAQSANDFGSSPFIPAEGVITISADCGVPQPPASGSIAPYSSTLEGAVISFQCGQGFSPSEEVTATCVRDEDTGCGTWTPDPAEHSCRSSIGGSKFELSTGGAVAITAVLCSIVFFILGTMFGILTYYCITAKRAQYSVSSSSTEPQTPAPVYEEITATDTHPKAIELSENVAYGPARQ